MNWSKLLIVSAALIYSGFAFSESDSKNCKQGYVFLGGLCHSYESLKEHRGNTFNSNTDGKPLTPEISAMLIHLMPEAILEFMDLYFDTHVSYMKTTELLDFDLSVKSYFSYLSYVPIQLDTSEIPEVFIRDESPGRCGSGGCSGFILDLDSSEEGDVLGGVFYSGFVVKPVIGPAPPPKSGYYDFAVVSDERINKYSYDSVKKSY